VVRTQKPFNAETPLDLLVDNMITPNEIFYVRNHLPVPEVDINSYTLNIGGEGLDAKSLTLDDLKTKFKIHKVTSTVQCAGNRRREFNKIKTVRGLEWDAGAIGTAEWTGVMLRDVLQYIGFDEDNSNFEHVHFVGMDGDKEKSYGASIPIHKAIDKHGDVLLAFEMNGKELPRDHGYPLRVIVPGVVGARNVKWLKSILLSKVESPSHWQQNDYKGFCPSVDWNNVDFSKSFAIQEPPVQSSICSHKDGQKISGDTITLKGYSWSGGGAAIIRVDLSIDGGKNWFTAELQKPNQKFHKTWAWTLWSADVKIP